MKTMTKMSTGNVTKVMIINILILLELVGDHFLNPQSRYISYLSYVAYSCSNEIAISACAYRSTLGSFGSSYAVVCVLNILIRGTR